MRTTIWLVELKDRPAGKKEGNTYEGRRERRDEELAMRHGGMRKTMLLERSD